jgi:hypothetical protein
VVPDAVADAGDVSRAVRQQQSGHRAIPSGPESLKDRRAPE